MNQTVRRRYYGAVHVHQGQFTQAVFHPKHVQLAKIDMTRHRIMVLDYAAQATWVDIDTLPKNWLCECANDHIQLFGGRDDGRIMNIPAILEVVRVPIMAPIEKVTSKTLGPDAPLSTIDYTRTDLWRARLVTPTKEKK